MRDKINFAILGYGTIGRRYAEVIREMPDVSLGALVDTAAMQTSAEMDCTVYHSLEDFLLYDISCNVVIVATPNGLHAEHAARCLKAGKHVLVEKPVAFTVKETEQLITVAHENKRALFPVWQIRYSPLIAALKKLVSAGALGKALWVQANCFWNRGEGYYNNHPWHGTLAMDGGPLYTQFSHIIDLFGWFYEEVSVEDFSFYKLSKHIKTEFEDSGVVNFRLDGEGAGLLSYTVSAPAGTSSNELTIITEKARIQLDGKYFERLAMLNTDDGAIEASIRTAVQDMPEDVVGYCRRRLIEDVCGAIALGQARDDKDIAGATELIEEIYKGRVK